jgi:predicted nucleic acid-binding protein
MRSYLHPKAISEWKWELKYIKKADAENKTLIATAQKEAIEQLQRYKSSNIFKDRTDIRYLAIVFIGKSEYTVTEL